MLSCGLSLSPNISGLELVGPARPARFSCVARRDAPSCQLAPELSSRSGPLVGLGRGLLGRCPASSLGQAWVGTATDILGWFIDIEVPLSFQVTVQSQGFQIVDVNSYCTCTNDKFKFNLIHPYTSFSEDSTITNSAAIYDSSPLDGYTISSVVTSINIPFSPMVE